MSKVHSSIACNLDADLLQAAFPLFLNERVQAIEWSFDTLFHVKEIPDWFNELLIAFGKANCLVGHGVFFSIFSGKWRGEQEYWLNRLQMLAQKFQFSHITEHFGFMTGQNFHKGAPLNIPFNKNTLAIGQDRLKRIQHACKCPVGLENLAFAYSIEEVKNHGVFLEKLLEPINGFIILDLHNLYCQIHNFNLEFSEIIKWYPLHLVREIHISGGSWEDSEIMPTKKVRRDTHDDTVPEAVFKLLEETIKLCPNLKFVILEQIGIGLKTMKSKKSFQQDFFRMDAIIQKWNTISHSKNINSFLPDTTFPLIHPIEDLFLQKQQSELSNILENALNYLNAKELLEESTLANSDWKIELWEPSMLETAIKIAQKWKQGFDLNTK